MCMSFQTIPYVILPSTQPKMTQNKHFYKTAGFFCSHIFISIWTTALCKCTRCLINRITKSHLCDKYYAKLAKNPQLCHFGPLSPTTNKPLTYSSTSLKTLAYSSISNFLQPTVYDSSRRGAFTSRRIRRAPRAPKS